MGEAMRLTPRRIHGARLATTARSCRVPGAPWKSTYRVSGTG
ncbi:hypothetical protein PJP07_10030 [Mycobacterium kansasii]